MSELKKVGEIFEFSSGDSASTYREHRALVVGSNTCDDHVSKSELRAWCEYAKPLIDGELAGYGTESPERQAIRAIFDSILEKFCGEEK